MFDWARGSALKRFIEAGLFMAGWDFDNARWLKNWHGPWLLGLMQFAPEMSILDVGSSHPVFMQYLHNNYGCEVHALDLPSKDLHASQFGFSTDAQQAFPEVTIHVGLAGDRTLPQDRFDLITCISTLEHSYDKAGPLEPSNPMPHLHALRDMARMLKPGGLFLMNWDIFLDGAHTVGWDFEIDSRLMLECGMRLACERRVLRGAQYLFDHPDSIFFDHEEVLKFDNRNVIRGTAINILWRKPGGVSQVELRPRGDLEDVYFPPGETQDAPPAIPQPAWTTEEIDQRFERIITRITNVLRRDDSTGWMTDRHGRIAK